MLREDCYVLGRRAGPEEPNQASRGARMVQLPLASPPHPSAAQYGRSCLRAHTQTSVGLTALLHGAESMSGVAW
jgi:hypothetical protein